MKYLFITLFAIVLACVAPCCLAKPNGGWSSGSGGGWSHGGSGGWAGGASGAGGGWGGSDGGSGWAGSGCASSGPQVVAANWAANLPGPSVRLLPVQAGIIPAAHSCGHSCGHSGGHSGH